MEHKIQFNLTDFDFKVLLLMPDIKKELQIPVGHTKMIFAQILPYIPIDNCHIEFAENHTVYYRCFNELNINLRPNGKANQIVFFEEVSESFMFHVLLHKNYPVLPAGFLRDDLPFGFPFHLLYLSL